MGDGGAAVDRDVAMCEGWDHQVDSVSIVDVQPEWRDNKVVESAFFDRERGDKRAPLVSRATHSIVQVRRVQNSLLLHWHQLKALFFSLVSSPKLR